MKNIGDALIARALQLLGQSLLRHLTTGRGASASANMGSLGAQHSPHVYLQSRVLQQELERLEENGGGMLSRKQA